MQVFFREFPENIILFSVIRSNSLWKLFINSDDGIKMLWKLIWYLGFYMIFSTNHDKISIGNVKTILLLKFESVSEECLLLIDGKSSFIFLHDVLMRHIW